MALLGVRCMLGLIVAWPETS